MRKVIAIVGPTASGKTPVSIELAKVSGSEIISADSRQIYKNIPIATAVPDENVRKNVIHHFIEILEPEDDYNAGRYGKDARAVIENLHSDDKNVIIVGGSGLYLRSLIDGLYEEEIDTSDQRNILYEKLQKNGRKALFYELIKIDPETASNLTEYDTRRIIRALEVFYTTGKKISELRKNVPKINFDVILFALQHPRENLYKKINERVDKMIEIGLINEVRKLYETGYHYKIHNSLNTVGIKEVMMYFDGEIGKPEMLELIKMNTRRYAKRQFTWFKKDKRINWIPVDENTTSAELINEIQKIYEANPGV
ncbi:MAG: tRNA delta(2)-isopentenylpyrophosphate transferase [Chlorobi bacterium OLB4]|nr:MAG: tRNA delta(2)-isopentenylpyrophosphate transferase [Chlorobi bacterium OLB4]MBW7855414.1 tRNA (adenosine(37)-N6)-dimethylallyltransferase MiaA [Ignavibacteria bacterium]OQY77000.1 MAG: tRNA (adenosine(37)-N6)-dimethylallyltransferase MiaA [Ignavibacteriales bacterium UTCHB1]